MFSLVVIKRKFVHSLNTTVFSTGALLSVNRVIAPPKNNNNNKISVNCSKYNSLQWIIVTRCCLNRYQQRNALQKMLGKHFSREDCKNVMFSKSVAKNVFQKSVTNQCPLEYCSNARSSVTNQCPLEYCSNTRSSVINQCPLEYCSNTRSSVTNQCL